MALLAVAYLIFLKRISVAGVLKSLKYVLSFFVCSCLVCIHSREALSIKPFTLQSHCPPPPELLCSLGAVLLTLTPHCFLLLSVTVGEQFWGRLGDPAGSRRGRADRARPAVG